MNNETIQPPETIFRLGAEFVGAELVVLLFRGGGEFVRGQDVPESWRPVIN